MHDNPDELLHDSAVSPFFSAWGALVLRHRFAFLGITLALVLLSIWLISTRLRIDVSVEAFSKPDDPSQIALEIYRDEFGRDDVFVVVMEGDVFSLPFLKRLRALHEDVALLDVPVTTLGERRQDRAVKTKKEQDKAAQAAAGGKREGQAQQVDDGGFEDDEGWGAESGGSVVEDVTSLLNVRRTRSVADGIEVGELLDPFPEQGALAALRSEVLADPTLVGQVVGAEGRHSVLLVRTQFMSEEDSRRVHDALAALLERHRSPGFELLLAGIPVLNAALQPLMLHDLRRMLMLSLCIMVFLLSFLFRHPLGVLPPLMVVGLASLNTFATMALADIPVTMMSNILPAFFFCVGMGDSVHLISVYRDRLQLCRDGRQAAHYAVATVGLPIFFTSMTTMVGLISFRFASVGPIQDVGTAGAFGVGMAMTHSLVFLPIALSFNSKHGFGMRSKQGADFLDRFLAGCLALSGERDDTGLGPESSRGRRRRLRVLWAGALLMVVAVSGASLLRVHHNPMDWLPEEEPIKAAFATTDEHLGGTANIQLLIDGHPERGMKDLELLRSLAKLEKHIRSYEDPQFGSIVGSAVSLLDVVRETHRALHGGEAAAYRLPDSERGLTDALFMFENAGPDELSRLATSDLSRSQMTVRIKWMDATSYGPLADHVEAGIKAFVPEGSTVVATGSVYGLISTIGALIGDLLRSFSFAFLVITVILALLLRNVRLGLIAMVPNLMPILCIMGLMGFTNIPIDMNNLLIASIAIGVAVDDTIHFLHHFWEPYKAHGNVEEALEASMAHAGRALVSTTIILTLGFFAYTGARMHNISRFGMLIGLTALIALLIDLIFAPALLRTFYPRQDASEAMSHESTD